MDLTACRSRRAAARTSRPGSGRPAGVLIMVLLALGAGLAAPPGKPKPAPPGTAETLPTGCPFYAEVDFQRDRDLWPAFREVFPSVEATLQVLAARSLITSPERITRLAFAGRLQGETVNIALLVEGELGLPIGVTRPDWTRVAEAGGRPVYRFREPAAGEPPVAFLVLNEKTLATGRQEVLLNLFGAPAAAAGLPGLFRKMRASPGAATLYVGPALLPHLLSLDPSADSWTALRRLLESFTEFAWNIDPRRTGAGELVLVCRQPQTAAEVSELLLNFFNLAILTSENREAGTRAIMESLRIRCQGREVHVQLTIPPTTLLALFAPSAP